MKKIMFMSLGCDKNSVDAEFMLGLLRDKGYMLTDDEMDADIIVVNTCAFIADAQQESIDTILEYAELKKAGVIEKLIVTGCLAQRYSEEIKKEIPEVSAIVGTTAYDKIIDAIEEGNDHIDSIDALPLPDTKRVCTKGGYFSYLKIAEGCDKRCSYCIIPHLRGKFRSIPMERLIEEAKFLAEGGAKELILIAQETTVYGTDIYGKKTLPELINRLSEIQGIEWIRLMYCYPEEITDELIEVIATNPKVCHYLDLPIQHASDAILKRMGRRTRGAEIEELIKKLKKRIPDIALRTSLIVGFPGETEEDHQTLLKFVEGARFQRLGCFTYSKETGTPAAKFPDQILKKVKVARRNDVMRLQQRVSKEFNASQIGRTLKVMVEGHLTEEDVWVGRSYMDAPDVDGYVFFTSPDSYLSGEFVEVKITSAKEYDLIGEAVID